MTMPAGWKAPIETTALGPERIVWHNELTKGIFHKQVVDIQRITNYRVIHNNSVISLKDVDDILVMNQRRVSQSSYMGTSTGRYTRFGYGTGRSTGISVGDLVFMYTKPIANLSLCQSANSHRHVPYFLSHHNANVHLILPTMSNTSVHTLEPHHYLPSVIMLLSYSCRSFLSLFYCLI